MVTHAAGDGFCPFCEPKTCTLATRSAWASGHFRRKSRVAILLLVVGVTPTGNRDAGKFAADATQLPTGCQPESLAMSPLAQGNPRQLLTCRELDGRISAAKAFDRLVADIESDL